MTQLNDTTPTHPTPATLLAQAESFRLAARLVQRLQDMGGPVDANTIITSLHRQAVLCEVQAWAFQSDQ